MNNEKFIQTWNELDDELRLRWLIKTKDNLNMPKYSLKILEDKIVIEIDNRRLYFNNFDTNMIFLLFEASGIKGIK